MSEVRVRFAPSPTGFVHIGSLRTALYNYLFARHNKGKLIIRIEDTDRSRYVEGAVENLLNTLKWAGIEYDEGPEKPSPCGPFYQSERLDIYRKHITILLQNGSAYPCFCSAERLEKMRTEQQKNNMPVRYDGTCRTLDGAEAEQRMASEEHVIRMRIPQSGETVVKDEIRGIVRFQNELIDEQVLIKADGFPTYHFANVVDDHLMGITHVIRGEEWLPSTPKHILLYEYFGWNKPVFAHLPLLLNPDRSKLSKRQGDVAVESYREKGYLKEALLNFVALLGWHESGDEEIFPLDELIEKFRLERVSKSGAVFNLEKLNWMNGVYLRKISEEEYLQLARQEMERAGLKQADPQVNRKIALAVRNGLTTLKDIPQRAGMFFSDEIESYSRDAMEWLSKSGTKALLKVMLEAAEKQPEITIDSFKEVMKEVQSKTGIKGKELWMPVRAAMTGMTEGPELPLVIEVLGKQRLISFLRQAIRL